MGTHRFVGRDGVALAYSELGSGRPLIMLHGFMGSGSHMLEYGKADALAGPECRVVLPDMRGHGDSTKSHDSADYPPDVLAEDGIALAEHLGFGDGEYDLGGYSLGARIVVRMLVLGAKPRRAIVAGQGLEKVTGPQGGGVNERVLTAMVDGTPIAPDSPEARIAQWMATLDADPKALLLLMDTLIPTTEDELRAITVPTLVAIGDRDERSDADELAALMPGSRFVRVPGDHGTAFGAPELTAAILGFLAED